MAVQSAVGPAGDTAPLQRVLQKIDELNNGDPRTIEVMLYTGTGAGITELQIHTYCKLCLSQYLHTTG